MGRGNVPAACALSRFLSSVLAICGQVLGRLSFRLPFLCVPFRPPLSALLTHFILAPLSLVHFPSSDLSTDVPVGIARFFGGGEDCALGQMRTLELRRGFV
jgi:hypothetical protein